MNGGGGGRPEPPSSLILEKCVKQNDLREVSFFTGRGAFENFSSFVNF